MSAKRSRKSLTRQDVESLNRVIAWLEIDPHATPIEIDVLQEVCERVQNHAHNAALVRIRIFNAGTSPTERARRMARHPNPRRPRQRPETSAEAQWNGRGLEWSVEELNWLEIYYRDGLTFAAIAERLGNRTQFAISAQVDRLGLTRTKPDGGFAKGNGGRRRHEDRGVLARARERRERMQHAMRERREESA